MQQQLNNNDSISSTPPLINTVENMQILEAMQALRANIELNEHNHINNISSANFNLNLNQALK